MDQALLPLNFIEFILELILERVIWLIGRFFIQFYQGNLSLLWFP